MKRTWRKLRRFIRREPVRALTITSIVVPLVASRLGVDGNELLALTVAVLGINGEVARARVSPVDSTP